MAKNPLLSIFLLLLSAAAQAAVTVTLTTSSGRDTAEAEKAISELLASPRRETPGAGIIRYRGDGWTAQKDAKLQALKAAWGPALTVEETSDIVLPTSIGRAPAALALARSGEAAVSMVPASLILGRHDEAYDNDHAHGEESSLAPAGSGPAVTPAAPTTPAAAQPGLPKPPSSGLDLAAIDRNEKPCEDFFQFACGNWIKANPIPPDQSRWGKFMGLRDQTGEKLKGLLEKAAKRDTLKKASADQKKLGEFYAACMDEKAAEKKGAAPLSADLGAIDMTTHRAYLASTLARLHRSGVGALFGFGSIQDYQNAQQVIAVIDQPGLSLPDRDLYLDAKSSDVLAGFHAHLVKMFTLIGDNTAKAEREASAVIAIEVALSSASLSRVDRRIPAKVNHKTTLAALKAQMPSFDWDAYLKGVGAPAFNELANRSPQFFAQLDGIVRATSMSDWRSYLRWQTIHGHSSLLSSDFVDAEFEFYGKQLSGQQELEPRWKRCVSMTNGALGDALGREYVNAYFDGNAKGATERMIVQIEDAMKEELETISWMTPATRQKALQKLAAVKNRIGYPDKWQDYSKLFVGTDAAANARNAETFAFAREMSQIGKPLDREAWDGLTAPTVNAFYSPTRNDINFPAGILQPPFYDPAADDAVNYGAIGGVEGHELIHGFDDQGRQYDGQGNLADWWTEQDRKAFEVRKKGIVDQYSGYTTYVDPKDPKKSVNVNGTLTCGENIADNGGVRLAYMAYMKQLQSKPGRALDGFTPQQRFFLGFAQLWCGSQTPESAKMMAKRDTHSPGQFRVRGVVSNMQEFAQAFSCQPGDPMVNAKPARVW